MKTTYLLNSAIALTLALSTPARGASLSFVPTGSQLDTDSVSDIEVAVGDSLDLSFFLDTTGLSANLQSIDIKVEQDLAESSLNAIRTEADIAAFPDLSFGGSPQDNGLFAAVFQRSGDVGLAPDTTIELVAGTLSILPGLNNDGAVDFSVSVVSAIDASGTDVTNLFVGAQNLELQQQSVPESTSILGLLALGFLGFGSFCQRAKPAKIKE